MLLALGQAALAQEKDFKKIAVEGFHPTKSSLPGLRSKGFMKTGLVPVYPSEADCPKITSLFAATTRGDGSDRNPRFFQCYHGGIDIPIAEGTPILAIAEGILIHKKLGRNIGGIEIVLQHGLGDTGRAVWTYSQYKHLKEMPDLEIGARVRRGDQIALAGTTGTTGYYGPRGHSHLHLSMFLSPDDHYVAERIFFPPKGQWMDPLALYRAGPLETTAIRSLPEKDKKVTIPHLTKDGHAVPETTRVVWPFACARR